MIPFICVNYNTSAETKKYISNVKSLALAEQALIIIVENSPGEEDFNELDLHIDQNYADDKNVVLLRRENNGYFQALNEGIRYAAKKGISQIFHVVGNNDITFQKDFIVYMLKADLDEKTLVLAPDVVSNEGFHENPHVLYPMGLGRKLKYDLYFSHYKIGNLLTRRKSTERKFKPYDPNRKVIHMGIGALYVLTPNFFRYFSELWEEVFLYGEEAVLAGQLSTVQGKTMYEPSLVCFHNESSSTSQMTSKRIYQLMQRSYRTYRKYL